MTSILHPSYSHRKGCFLCLVSFSRHQSWLSQLIISVHFMDWKSQKWFCSSFPLAMVDLLYWLERVTPPPSETDHTLRLRFLAFLLSNWLQEQLLKCHQVLPMQLQEQVLKYHQGSPQKLLTGAAISMHYSAIWLPFHKANDGERIFHWVVLNCRLKGFSFSWV